MGDAVEFLPAGIIIILSFTPLQAQLLSDDIIYTYMVKRVAHPN